MKTFYYRTCKGCNKKVQEIINMSNRIDREASGYYCIDCWGKYRLKHGHKFTLGRGHNEYRNKILNLRIRKSYKSAKIMYIMRLRGW